MIVTLVGTGIILLSQLCLHRYFLLRAQAVNLRSELRELLKDQYLSCNKECLQQDFDKYFTLPNMYWRFWKWKFKVQDMCNEKDLNYRLVNVRYKTGESLYEICFTVFYKGIYLVDRVPLWASHDRFKAKIAYQSLKNNPDKIRAWLIAEGLTNRNIMVYLNKKEKERKKCTS